MKATRQIRRALRPMGKFLLAAARWKRLSFTETPPVFGNAKPKSGSHLLLQILNGLCRIAPYAFVASDPIRTITKGGRRRSQEEILADLRQLRRGMIGWGYLEPTRENITFLCQSSRVNYFIYRDPRDTLVSHVFFATDMHEEHGMHAYYKSLPGIGERLKVAISGIDRNGMYMVNVRQRYEAVFKWREQPGVMCIRFEDLIDNRDATLQAMLDQIEKTGYRFILSREKAVATLVEAIQPRKSHTFRLGKTGGWREYFTNEHKELFKDVAGDLLIRLGYEQDNNW